MHCCQTCILENNTEKEAKKIADNNKKFRKFKFHFELYFILYLFLKLISSVFFTSILDFINNRIVPTIKYPAI